MELDSQITESMEHILAKYPQKRSALLPFFYLFQEKEGYVSKEAISFIAKKLELQEIEVLSTLTFYSMFRQEPIGKVHVKVCRTLSCALRGAYPVCRKIKKILGCEAQKTSADGKYTVEFVECIADCWKAPVVQVNERLYEGVTPEKVNDLVAKIKQMALGQKPNDEVGGVDIPAFKG